ncbi:MAG: hypothetical protein ABSF89_02830 [Acidimicrobiales bacterium]
MSLILQGLDRGLRLTGAGFSINDPGVAGTAIGSSYQSRTAGKGISTN